MTSRDELFRLAYAIGTSIECVDGSVSRVRAFGETYGDGCMLSLLDFAERARREIAKKQAA